MTETGSFIRRTFSLLILIALAAFNVLGTFRGLDTMQGMEQAQLSREIARGKDFHTKVLRPAAIWQYERDGDKKVDLADMRDTYHSPLNPLVNAMVLKAVGGDDADKWRMQEGEMVYGLDRIIAAISVIFFVMAVGLNYLLFSRLFDSKIAAASAALMMLCNLMWEFSKSGLPQMLMLFLFSLASLFIFLAIDAKTQNKSGVLQALLGGFCLVLLCLAHWLAIWIFVGYLIFATFYFRPRGIIAIVLVGLFALLAAYPLMKNQQFSGTIFGTAFLTIYDGLGSTGSEDAIMREDNLANQALDLKGMVKKIAFQTLSQTSDIYRYMGSIIVAPIFFLALFHAFRRQAIADFRWVILLMWVFAAIGMAIFGLSDDQRDSNQLHILFAPIMSAYGLAFFVIVWSRLKLGENASSMKYVPHVLAVVISAGPMLLNLPQQVEIAAYTSQKGFPHWPPYYPPALNMELSKLTSSDEIIVTDQPWAVAWYADRTALWLPQSTAAVMRYIEQADNQRTPISGILITPYSHSMKPLRSIEQEYRSFLPLVMDGPTRRMTNSNASIIAGAKELEPIMAQFKYPSPLVGVDMIFYGANTPK